MSNGQDLIFIQDKDSSDGIFGNIGNNVETTIVVKQFWNEYEKNVIVLISSKQEKKQTQNQQV